MVERTKMVTFPNGVQLLKWGRTEAPTAESVAEEMQGFGYAVYDLQTCAPWFERSRHAHDDPEIRGAVSGTMTFHFDDFPITLEGGDILLIPGKLSALQRLNQYRLIDHLTSRRIDQESRRLHQSKRLPINEVVRRFVQWKVE